MHDEHQSIAGIGGDAFCLFYEASSKKVTAMLGCGRSPAALTLEVSQDSCSETPFALQLLVGASSQPGQGSLQAWEALYTDMPPGAGAPATLGGWDPAPVNVAG